MNLARTVLEVGKGVLMSCLLMNFNYSAEKIYKKLHLTDLELHSNWHEVYRLFKTSEFLYCCRAKGNCSVYALSLHIKGGTLMSLILFSQPISST